MFNEKYPNQIPALQKLINLGYTYIPPSQAFKPSKSVLLEDVLKIQLRKLNPIFYQKKQYILSDENIVWAIEQLRSLFHHKASDKQKIYDMLTTPRSSTQSIDGNIQYFDFLYIDCKNWENNVYHCTTEYPQQRQRVKTTSPEIILYINGIPLAVIDCTSPENNVLKVCEEVGLYMGKVIETSLRYDQSNSLDHSDTYLQFFYYPKLPFSKSSILISSMLQNQRNEYDTNLNRINSKYPKELSYSQGINQRKSW